MNYYWHSECERWLWQWNKIKLIAHTHIQSQRREFARRPKPDLGNSVCVFLYIYCIRRRVFYRTHTHTHTRFYAEMLMKHFIMQSTIPHTQIWNNSFIALIHRWVLFIALAKKMVAKSQSNARDGRGGFRHGRAKSSLKACERDWRSVLCIIRRKRSFKKPLLIIGLCSSRKKVCTKVMDIMAVV